MDIHALDWLGLEWLRWQSLDPADGALSSVSTDEGLYRIRHPDYPELVYIGETDRSTHGRLRALARETYAEEIPFRWPHTALHHVYGQFVTPTDPRLSFRQRPHR